jgi:hypothetical protein
MNDIFVGWSGAKICLSKLSSGQMSVCHSEVASITIEDYNWDVLREEGRCDVE